MGGPLTERFLLVLNWDGAGAYTQADRHVWKIKSTDTEVAGFVRQVNDFTQVKHIPIYHTVYQVPPVDHLAPQIHNTINLKNDSTKQLEYSLHTKV